MERLSTALLSSFGDGVAYDPALSGILPDLRQA